MLRTDDQTHHRASDMSRLLSRLFSDVYIDAWTSEGGQVAAMAAQDAIEAVAVEAHDAARADLDHAAVVYADAAAALDVAAAGLKAARDALEAAEVGLDAADAGRDAADHTEYVAPVRDLARSTPTALYWLGSGSVIADIAVSSSVVVCSASSLTTEMATTMQDNLSDAVAMGTMMYNQLRSAEYDHDHDHAYAGPWGHELCRPDWVPTALWDPTPMNWVEGYFGSGNRVVVSSLGGGRGPGSLLGWHLQLRDWHRQFGASYFRKHGGCRSSCDVTQDTAARTRAILPYLVIGCGPGGFRFPSPLRRRDARWAGGLFVGELGSEAWTLVQPITVWQLVNEAQRHWTRDGARFVHAGDRFRDPGRQIRCRTSIHSARPPGGRRQGPAADRQLRRNAGRSSTTRARLDVRVRSARRPGWAGRRMPAHSRAVVKNHTLITAPVSHGPSTLKGG